MQALAPEHVVYAGTASKTLAPGLRLAWLVLRRQLVEEVVAAKEQADRHTGVLDQLTLAEFIARGDYDRHVRRARLAYRRRRDRLVAALRGTGSRACGSPASRPACTPWLTLRPDGSEEEVVARAAGHGLALEGLGVYRMGARRQSPALVVGYATPPDHAYTGAVARLAAVLGER